MAPDARLPAQPVANSNVCPGAVPPSGRGRFSVSWPVTQGGAEPQRNGGRVSATGLSADPAEYQRRLEEQSDQAVDAYAAELMRDLSIRIGVIRVLEDFRQATGLSEQELERVYAVGGGAPATFGRTAEGKVMVPAISLHYLVPGLRHETTDGASA